MATRGRCPNDGAENNAINYANSSLPRVKTEIMTSELRDTERERESACSKLPASGGSMCLDLRPVSSN